MLLGFLALTACGGEAPLAVAETTEEGFPSLFVDVGARVADSGVPAAWVVQASWGAPASTSSSSVGVCRRPSARFPLAASTGEGRRRAESVSLSGASDTELEFEPATGTWESAGPRHVLDPAWSVADVAWVDLGGLPHRADDAVRFGGLPDVTRVVRDREGGVDLGWDPATVGATEVRVSGPAGTLVCGTGPDGTTLPWWVVPAYGGEVVLESVRENSALVDGVLVRVRTTLQRVIRLDEPAGTTAEEKSPAFRPYSSQGPVRLVRPAKRPVG